MKLPANFAPLRHGPFARYMAGEAISMVGTWMQVSAQGWVMTSLTPTARALAWQYFLTGIPMLIFSLKGGSVADRLDRRWILQGALIMQMLCALTMGWLLATHQQQVWHFYAAAALLGVVAAFEVPAVSAFVPDLVPRAEMSAAIAMDRSVFHATRLIGPALGGYLVGRFGESTAYFANSASYLALMAALLTIPRKKTLQAVSSGESSPEEKENRASILAGLRHVRGDAPSLAMVLMISAMTCFVSPLLVIFMPFYAKHLLALGPGYMGVLMGASGVGSFVGSIGLLGIPHGHRAFALKIGSAATVVALVGLALSQSFAWSVAALILLTLGLSTGFGLSNIVIQERAPDELRGRVSAVAGLSFFGLLPFSGLAIAWIVDHVGMREAIGGCAVAYGIATLLLLAGRKHLGHVKAPPDAPAEQAAEAAREVEA